MNKKYNFYDLSFEDLKLFLIDKIGIEEHKSSMRAKQIFHAIYRKGLKDFKDLTTASLDLRKKLDNIISLDLPKIIKTEIADDKTIKWLLELNDEIKI